MKKFCGDANPKGNVAFYYKGACKQEIDLEDSYRCTGCGGWFHLGCIFTHFAEEKNHDLARNNLKIILDYTNDDYIKKLCKEGLQQNTVIGINKSIFS